MKIIKDESLLKKPQHIAIIMDGNGRWAQEKNHKRFYGHVKGLKAAKEIVRSCVKKKIKNLTLFIFSRENWSRPKDEIYVIMKLIEKSLATESDQLVKNNIKFFCIGELHRLPQSVLFKINENTLKTKNNTGMNLTFAISYSGRHEIIKAIKKTIQKIESKKMRIEDLNEETFSDELDSSFLPYPDLVIRTSGENRLSNFFLWQMAYSEIFFTPKYWPDFSEKDLNEALQFFSKKERRFGKVSHQKNINVNV